MRTTRRHLALLAALLAAACDGGMDDQGPYHRPDEPGSALFDPVPPNTVPRGMLDHEAAAAAPTQAPSPRRGQPRYEAFCAPCHGVAGYGDGIAVRHGFPAPPSFHEPGQRELDLARIVEAVTRGKGRMYPFADRIPPMERWDIAAYVKALQLSRSVPAGSLPAEDRGRLP